ncbi:hypothetical protein JNUCC81_16690 [Faecalimicrobium sp. JNUCC 81]
MVTCILSATFSELVRSILVRHRFKGNWRKLDLVLESISLFFIGLIPTSCSDFIVTNLVSFLWDISCFYLENV